MLSRMMLLTERIERVQTTDIHGRNMCLSILKNYIRKFDTYNFNNPTVKEYVSREYMYRTCKRADKFLLKEANKL